MPPSSNILTGLGLGLALRIAVSVSGIGGSLFGQSGLLPPELPPLYGGMSINDGEGP
jgi:hypothetical protein